MNYFTSLNNPMVNILLCTFWHFGTFFWTYLEVLGCPRSSFEFPVRTGSKNVQFWGAFVTEYQITPKKMFQFIIPPAIWEYQSSAILIAKTNRYHLGMVINSKPNFWIAFGCRNIKNLAYYGNHPLPCFTCWSFL